MYDPRTSVVDRLAIGIVGLVRTLPAPERDKNREALNEIVDELRGTYEAELPWLRAVKRVPVDDPQAVRELRDKLELYDDMRLWDATRTHCSHIRSVTNAMLEPYRQIGDRGFIATIEAVLDPVLVDDSEFIDDIEAAMADARTALVAIDNHASAGRPDLARGEQEAYAAAYDAHIEMLKARLGALTTAITPGPAV